LTRITLAAVGFDAAANPKTLDAISVIIDAMIASGSFRCFTFWNIVAIAFAKFVVHLPPLDEERLTLEEVTCDV
jgi:hypothetical protein